MVPSGHSFLLHKIELKGPCSSKRPHIQVLLLQFILNIRLKNIFVCFRSSVLFFDITMCVYYKFVDMQILGTMIAPPKDAWGGCSEMWLSISEVKGLIVDGSGTIDGQGQTWWPDTDRHVINILFQIN